MTQNDPRAAGQRRIAVVTPYYKESLDVLRQCHESVLAQEVDAEVRHMMVADGHAKPEIDRWLADHVVLPRAHGDNGNTPRGIGALLADSEGYDFIAFLDADNWFYPKHLHSLLELHVATGAALCASWRKFHAPNGALIEGIDAHGKSFIVNEFAESQLLHVDTSCMLLHRPAFPINNVWTRMPRPVTAICDRVFFAACRHRGISFISSKQRTVAFRTTYSAHFLPGLDFALPEDGEKKTDGIRAAHDWLKSRHGAEQCLDRLGFWPAQYMS
jgi:glycosyltransferase involved in cell wall biosynthesis